MGVSERNGKWIAETRQGWECRRETGSGLQRQGRDGSVGEKREVDCRDKAKHGETRTTMRAKRKEKKRRRVLEENRRKEKKRTEKRNGRIGEAKKKGRNHPAVD